MLRNKDVAALMERSPRGPARAASPAAAATRAFPRTFVTLEMSASSTSGPHPRVRGQELDESPRLGRGSSMQRPHTFFMTRRPHHCQVTGARSPSDARRAWRRSAHFSAARRSSPADGFVNCTSGRAQSLLVAHQRGLWSEIQFHLNCTSGRPQRLPVAHQRGLGPNNSVTRPRSFRSRRSVLTNSNENNVFSS
jgi:hypothetical protein